MRVALVEEKRGELECYTLQTNFSGVSRKVGDETVSELKWVSTNTCHCSQPPQPEVDIWLHSRRHGTSTPPHRARTSREADGTAMRLAYKVPFSFVIHLKPLMSAIH